ncbi:MAG: hypothetical protein JXB00_10045 [Bacteroidales bacterium]|nr:hypothetical protein [Bacteroidales bacterium]
MKPSQINLLNAAALMLIGTWGYYATGSTSLTALIPVISGIVLLILGLGFKSGNKIMAHVIVVLTLLIIISLFKPLSGAISRGDGLAILRVLVMIATGIVAIVVYIKSFIAARKNRL